MSMSSRLWSCFASRVPALSAVVLALAASSAAAQDTTGVGAISGAVVSAAGQPAEGVRVCALDTGACATTDARGVFRIGDLRAGRYRLEILPLEGMPFTSDEVDVRAGLDGTVEITLPTAEDFRQTVTVTAPAFQAPEAVKNSGFLVAPREILKGAAALQDVSRYVQGLPGVAIGTNDFRNDIIVRGGSPLENLFMVDNVEIPNINAFANFASAGGTVSLLDAELLQDVTFLTGGYPAPYINRTSSVLQVTQREGSRKAFGGWATLGFAGAGAILEGPINAGKGSWVLSARRSFLDLFTDDVGFGGVPVVYSFNAKAVYDLIAPRPHLGGEHRRHRRDSPWPHASRRDLEEEIANFDIRYDGWRSATGFNWQRTFGSRGVGLLGITHSEAKVGQQVKDLVAQGVPPPGVPPEVVIARSPVVYFEDSREGETTDQVRLDRAPAVLRHGAGRRQLQDVPHRLHGGIALRQRHAVLAGARHRSVLSRHAVPVVSDRRLPAGLEAGGVARERHAGRTLRSLRHPVAGPVQPARGRQRAPHRHAVVELERRVVLSAAGVPLRVGVSPERVARALAGRPLS